MKFNEVIRGVLTYEFKSLGSTNYIIEITKVGHYYESWISAKYGSKKMLMYRHWAESYTIEEFKEKVFADAEEAVDLYRARA